MPMVAIKNALWGALTLDLKREHPLTLGPRETATISQEEFETEDCQKAFREMKIIVLPSKQAPA